MVRESGVATLLTRQGESGVATDYRRDNGDCDRYSSGQELCLFSASLKYNDGLCGGAHVDNALA